MKRFLLWLLLVPLAHAAPITVSGTMHIGSGVALQGNAFVRFRLRNFAGFVPRVVGTAIVVQPQFDVKPDGTGVFTSPVYSNDDIVPNTCGSGTEACTWWTVEFWNGGKVAVTGNYCIPNTSPTYNLNSATPCQTPPLPPGPVNFSSFLTQAYQTVMDESSTLPQRSTIKFTGAGITCTDSSPNTVCDVPSGGGGGITGSGTENNMMVWGPTNTAIDSNLVVGSGSMQTPNVASGSSIGLTLQTGTTADASSSFRSGNVTLRSGAASAGATSGTVSLSTGSAKGSASAGGIFIQPGSIGSAGTGDGGDIHLIPGDREGSTGSRGGLIYCDDRSATETPGCNINMWSEGGAGTVGFMAGTGVPSGNCQMPKTNPKLSNIPILYLRTDPAGASTFLYVCTPPSTWTAIAVP